MGRDILESRWAQLRDHLKVWWNRLDDADLEGVGGSRDALVELLQKKYGYARPVGYAELGRHLRKYQVDLLLARPTEKAQP